MMSEEALIGARVRVGESGGRSEWHGLTGTTTAKWGNPEYLAFDVLLDDGRTQLFWCHELEELERRSPKGPGGRTRPEAPPENVGGRP